MTLETRRIRADLLEIFKIFKIFMGIENIDPAELFSTEHTRSTGGHHYKIKKLHSRLNIWKYFFPRRIVSKWNRLPEEAIVWRYQPLIFKETRRSPAISSTAIYLVSNFRLITSLRPPTQLLSWRRVIYCCQVYYRMYCRYCWTTVSIISTTFSTDRRLLSSLKRDTLRKKMINHFNS